MLPEKTQLLKSSWNIYKSSSVYQLNQLSICPLERNLMKLTFVILFLTKMAINLFPHEKFFIFEPRTVFLLPLFNFLFCFWTRNSSHLHLHGGRQMLP